MGAGPRPFPWAACGALLLGNLKSFGDWVDRSQKNAENLLGNQVPETAFLAASAREHGALAASAFGAGFGGSVWAMVKTDEAGPFLENWRRAYQAEFPDPAGRSDFFTTAAGHPAFRLA